MSLGALITTYLALLALLATEFAASFLRLDPSMRVLLLLPALLMVGVVATCFMELKREGPVPLLFAASGAFWIIILLGLGLADPLTRAVYPAPGSAASTAVKGLRLP